MNHNYFLKFNRRLPEDNTKKFKLLVYAIVIGVITGLIGAFFRLALIHIGQLKASLLNVLNSFYDIPWVWGSLLAVIGIILSIYLVRKFAPEASGSGIQEIEGALDGIRPLRWKRVLPVKFTASLFSLSSGLLLGREGPTIQLGANAGKMVKDVFRQKDEENNPLISTGSAAGLASAFNAPFSGIIFVIEEMNGHFKFNFYSVACIMLGAGTADIVVRILVGNTLTIPMQILGFEHLSKLWLFVVLGISIGVLGYAFNKTLLWGMRIFETVKNHYILLSLILGILVTLVGFYSSDMIYAGYTTISNLLEQQHSMQILFVLLVVRFILSIVSYLSGVPGGIFAPLLTIGVVSGMLFANFTKVIMPNLIIESALFAVAGMAAIFSSTVRAPITGLVLAVEMTANFGLILPLIITVVSASVITTMLGNQPIYASLLERTLKHTPNEK